MKCDGCGNCVDKCPQNALELQTMTINLEDKTVAAVTEQHRKKIRYTCASCKPEEKKATCILICEKKAINTIWNPKIEKQHSETTSKSLNKNFRQQNITKNAETTVKRDP